MRVKLRRERSGSAAATSQHPKFGENDLMDDLADDPQRPADAAQTDTHTTRTPADDIDDPASNSPLPGSAVTQPPQEPDAPRPANDLTHGWNVLLQVSSVDTRALEHSPALPEARALARARRIGGTPGSRLVPTVPNGPMLDRSRAAPQGRPPAAAPVKTPTRRTGRALTGRLPRIAAAVVVVIAVAVGLVTYLILRSDSSKPAARGTGTSSASSTPPGTSAASPRFAPVLAWMKTNIQLDDRIAAGPAAAANLKRHKFSAVTTLRSNVSAATLDRSLDWLIADPATRGRARLAPLFKDSITVASFGTGANSVQVRSFVAHPHRSVAAVVAADKSNRQLAGVGLAANPNVTANSAVRAQLQAGDVDLRSATFLAVLASTTPVQVLRAPESPAERAASRPARELVISARPADVRTTLKMLPVVYRPAHVRESQQRTTLIWDPAVNPVQPTS